MPCVLFPVIPVDLFVHDRSGMVLGEGAGMLVLESEEHAETRGAKIYAELGGYGMTSDAGHITRPDVAGITGVMRNALQNSNINFQDVDYINAHGTATTANDIAENRSNKLSFWRLCKRFGLYRQQSPCTDML